MADFLNAFNALSARIIVVLWHPLVLYALLAVGVLFTLWSRGVQYRALTHGVAVLRGRYSDHDGPSDDPGAINHFQALSAALSATVGLGNIGGVALAISLGGPGSVFWMWVAGVLGMALKSTEVTLSMRYRNLDDPANPHGGPMWVARLGIARKWPRLARLGTTVGGIFAVTLLISTFTGGNLFQAWNVGNITQTYFGIPSLVVGIVLAIIVGMVILGGIQRIGVVAGRLVPIMCGGYLLAALLVIAMRIEQLPSILRLIVASAFGPQTASGAFLGGTAAIAFGVGLQRAFFSNEAGQGSSPMAHCAARTREPAREGLVAGLEPFIDTLVVCTLTAMVILLSGAWNRAPDLAWRTAPRVVTAGDGVWTLDGGGLPARVDRGWRAGDTVQVAVAPAQEDTPDRASTRPVAITGTVASIDPVPVLRWSTVALGRSPVLVDPNGVYLGYSGAALTAHAFDRVQPGLGTWLVSIATWLFGLSTLISWSYYGEQGWIYLFKGRGVTWYRLLFCLAIPVACSGLVRTTTELSNLTLIGTGVMLWANIPITLLFARETMATQRDYLARMGDG